MSIFVHLKQDIMDLVFATGNMGKLREASEILGSAFRLCTPADLGYDEDVEETGVTMLENAVIKAEHLWNLAHRDCDTRGGR